MQDDHAILQITQKFSRELAILFIWINPRRRILQMQAERFKRSSQVTRGVFPIGQLWRNREESVAPASLHIRLKIPSGSKR
ncbi:MAG: hypothetical protein QOE34_2216 [Verrucomicrobiota bacterium]